MILGNLNNESYMGLIWWLISGSKDGWWRKNGLIVLKNINLVYEIEQFDRIAFKVLKLEH